MGAGIWIPDDATPDSAPRDEWSYRFRVKEGDFVRMPDGRTGVVSMIEHLPLIIYKGPKRTSMPDLVQVVSVMPDRRRWFGLRAPIPVRLAETDIDALELLATREQLEDPLGLEP